MKREFLIRKCRIIGLFKSSEIRTISLKSSCNKRHLRRKVEKNEFKNIKKTIIC